MFSNSFKISKPFFQVKYIDFTLTLIALIAAFVMRIILALEMGGFISISEKSLKTKTKTSKNNLLITGKGRGQFTSSTKVFTVY